MLHLSLRPRFSTRTVCGVAIYRYPQALTLPIPIIPVFCRGALIKSVSLNGLECPPTAIYPINHEHMYEKGAYHRQFTSLLDIQDAYFTARLARHRVGDFFIDLSAGMRQYSLELPGCSDGIHFRLRTILFVFELNNPHLFQSYSGTSYLLTGGLSTFLELGTSGDASDWLPVPLFSMSIKHNISVQVSGVPPEYRPICGGRLSICQAPQASSEAVGYLFTGLRGNVHNIWLAIARADSYVYIPDGGRMLEQINLSQQHAAKVYERCGCSSMEFDALLTESKYHLAANPSLSKLLYRPLCDSSDIPLVIHYAIFSNIRRIRVETQLHSLYRIMRYAIKLLELGEPSGDGYVITVLFSPAHMLHVFNGVIILPLALLKSEDSRRAYTAILCEAVSRYLFGVLIPSVDYASLPTTLLLADTLRIHLIGHFLGFLEVQRLFYAQTLRSTACMTFSTPTLWSNQALQHVTDRYNAGRHYLWHVKEVLSEAYGTPLSGLDDERKMGTEYIRQLQASSASRGLRKSFKIPLCISRAEVLFDMRDPRFRSIYDVVTEEGPRETVGLFVSTGPDDELSIVEPILYNVDLLLGAFARVQEHRSGQPGRPTIEEISAKARLNFAASPLPAYYITEPLFPIRYAVTDEELRIRTETIALLLRNNLTGSGLTLLFKACAKHKYVDLGAFFASLDGICTKHTFTGGTWIAPDDPSFREATQTAEYNFLSGELTVLPKDSDIYGTENASHGFLGVGPGFSHRRLDQENSEAHTELPTRENHSTHPFTVVVHHLGVTGQYICGSSDYNVSVQSTDFKIDLFDLGSGLQKRMKDNRCMVGIPIQFRDKPSSQADQSRKGIILPPQESLLARSGAVFQGLKGLAAELKLKPIQGVTNEAERTDRSRLLPFFPSALITLTGTTSSMYTILQEPRSNSADSLCFGLLRHGEGGSEIQSEVYKTLTSKNVVHLLVDPYAQLPFLCIKSFVVPSSDNAGALKDLSYLSIATIDTERNLVAQLQSINSLCHIMFRDQNQAVLKLLVGILRSPHVSPALQETALQVLIRNQSGDSNCYYMIAKALKADAPQWGILLSLIFGDATTSTLEEEDISYTVDDAIAMGGITLQRYALYCGCSPTSRAKDLISIFNTDRQCSSSRHALTIACLQGLTWQLIRGVITHPDERYMVLRIIFRLFIEDPNYPEVRAMAMTSLVLIVITAWKEAEVPGIILWLLAEKDLISPHTAGLLRLFLKEEQLFGLAKEAVQRLPPSPTLLPCKCYSCSEIMDDSSDALFVMAHVALVHLFIDILCCAFDQAAEVSSGVRQIHLDRYLLHEVFSALKLLGSNSTLVTDDQMDIAEPLSVIFYSSMYRGTSYVNNLCYKTYIPSYVESLLFMDLFNHRLLSLGTPEGKHARLPPYIPGCPICISGGSCRCIRVSWPSVTETTGPYSTVRCLDSDLIRGLTQEDERKLRGETESITDYIKNHLAAQDLVTRLAFESSKGVENFFGNCQDHYVSNGKKGAIRSNLVRNCPEYTLAGLACFTNLNQNHYSFLQSMHDSLGCVLGHSVSRRLVSLALYRSGPDLRGFRRAALWTAELSFALLNAISALHGVTLLDADVDRLTPIETEAYVEEALATTAEHTTRVNAYTLLCEDTTLTNMRVQAADECILQGEFNVGYLIHTRYRSAHEESKGVTLRYGGYLIVGGSNENSS
ncbi:hypothetical protein GMRT_10490 [Giardia muris]|uniref:Uncharacterized protein n=1 Tax=Giardia muris TaxID=5742 RepID=A0A4Z1T1T4_GIAMU|nr:hypothetical protein GMRT_10490 [Giardia muris]|eukprot:TNJ26519.1 hypothetical protein GMRT_10490 [Giardia muris]